MHPTFRNVLVGVVAALAVIGVYAALSHRGIVGPWYSSPIASSTVSGTSTASEDTAHWKRYANETYHITLLYPDYFADIKEVNAGEREIVSYDPKTGKSVESKVKPLFSADGSTDLKGNHPGLTITVTVWDSKNYGFLDTPGGRAWSYEASSKTMWMGGKTRSGWGDWKKTLPTLSANTWSGYDMGTGDAGFSERSVAVPLPHQGKIVELDFGREPEANDQIPVNQILSTLHIE